MITPDDVKYHTPHDPGYEWGETNFFYFYIPEIHLIGGFQTLNRKCLGVSFVDININDNLSMNCLEHLYIDGQQHLPAVDRLENSTFVNGLSIKSLNPPKDYKIYYHPNEDILVDLIFCGIAEPYDIHDTRQDGSIIHKDIIPEAFRTGHFDLSGRITGKFSLRNRNYDVDCIATMDHSWGPRSQTGMGLAGANWLDANFGTDYTMHLNMLLDLDLPPNQQFKLVSGYVKDGEQIYSLIEASLTASRVQEAENLAAALELKVIDVRGKSHVLYGSTLALCKPHQYPSFQIHQTLVRWVSDQGRIGYGTNMEGRMLPENNKRKQFLYK